MKNRLYTSLTLSTFMLLITACGGGGGEGSTPTNPAIGKGIVICEGSDQGLAKATTLEAGKRIQQVKNDPHIRLWHLSDGSIKACVIDGSAEVL